jgi:hypothetical protein
MKNKIVYQWSWWKISQVEIVLSVFNGLRQSLCLFYIHFFMEIWDFQTFCVC